MNQIVFDTGALIGMERRQVRVWRLVQRMGQERRKIHVPAGVLTQAWRGSPKQHEIATLRKSGTLVVDPLTERLALEVGSVLAAAGTSDVVDAHVALLARKLRGTVVTSDPDDLARIDSSLPLVEI